MQVTLLACPRDQEDPTAVLRDESGVIVFGEDQDGGQGADQDDVGLVRGANTQKTFRAWRLNIAKFLLKVSVD